MEHYVGLEHLDAESICSIRRWGTPRRRGQPPSVMFKQGDMIFGKRRAYQRKLAVAEFDGICSGDSDGAASQDPKVVLPEFLPFFMQSDLLHESRGGNLGRLAHRPRSTGRRWRLQEFALPPMEEQQLSSVEASAAHCEMRAC